MQCRVNVIIRVFLQFDIITGKMLYTLILGHDSQMTSGRRPVATCYNITPAVGLLMYSTDSSYLPRLEKKSSINTIPSHAPPDAIPNRMSILSAGTRE